MNDDLPTQIRAWTEDVDRPIPLDEVRRRPRPSTLSSGRSVAVLAIAAALLLVAGTVAALTGSDRPAALETIAEPDEEVTTTVSEAPTTAPTTTAAGVPPETTTSAVPTTAAPPAATEPVDPPAKAPDPAPTDPAAPLRGRTFESVSVVDGSTERAFVDEGTVRVQFEGTPTGDVVRWRISCNTAGGSLTATAERLTVHDIASSAAGCDEAREAEDRWIGSFFASGPTWLLEGSRLVLRSDDTTITLGEVPPERFGA